MVSPSLPSHLVIPFRWFSLNCPQGRYGLVVAMTTTMMEHCVAWRSNHLSLSEEEGRTSERKLSASKKEAVHLRNTNLNLFSFQNQISLKTQFLHSRSYQYNSLYCTLQTAQYTFPFTAYRLQHTAYYTFQHDLLWFIANFFYFFSLQAWLDAVFVWWPPQSSSHIVNRQPNKIVFYLFVCFVTLQVTDARSMKNLIISREIKC